MFLGIDIGTSAVKAVLCDDMFAIVAEATAALHVNNPKPLWSEQEPDDWWQAVCTTAAALRQSNPSAWAAAKAIGLSGQMHGAVTLDASAKVLRPAILWNDGRSFKECETLEQSYPQLGAVAGVPAMPGFTAPKILWMQRHEPALYRRIRHVLLPKDYVRLRLTGDRATDMSDAAGTLWLDQAQREWSPAIAAASATDIAWLPSLYEGNQIAGVLRPTAATELALPAGIPVAAGGGDAGTGAVGIGAIDEGDAFVSLGTSGQFFVADTSYRPNPKNAVHAFAHAVPERWFRMAAVLNGASPLAWYAGICGLSVPDLLQAASSADIRAAADVPLFLPYLTGERTPHNDPHIRGGFFGLGAATDRAGMARAVVDAVAYSLCDAAAALAAAGSAPENAMAIGGGAQSDILLQTVADAVSVRLQRGQDVRSGPAFGAAKLAAVAAGAANASCLRAKPDVACFFDPRPQFADYHADRLHRYRALYSALRPLYRSEGL